jgi:predicted dienelactone hydrolase
MIRMLLALITAVIASSAIAESWNAGWRQIAIRDPQTGGEMPVMLWYPTTAPAPDTAFGPFIMPVAREAAVAPGRYGLVVLSHGSGGSLYNHRNIAVALAQRGYVAAAPLHPRDNARDHRRCRTPRRPPAAARNAVSAPPSRPVPRAAQARCRRRRNGPPRRCVADRRRAPRPHRPAPHRSPPRPAAAGRPRHPRIRAAVAMAPVGAIFTSAALGGIRGALRIYHAEQEELLTERHHAGKVRDALAGRAEYVSLANAGHFSFLAPFPPALVAQVGVAAQDPPGLDRAVLQTRLEQEIAAFFDAKLPR